MRISVCIATYRRSERLAALLADMIHQDLVPFEVVVIDNDVSGSAGAVVQQAREFHPPYPIHYEIQPVKNISLTRNRSVAAAAGDWLAFIDDDERASPAWLKELATSALSSAADGVLGPVVPVLPPNAPDWIRHGTFYDWARQKSGTRVPANRLRFGNVLLRADLMHGARAPFDARYGLTGGEDGDLLGRLTQSGARIVWCDEAVVFEPVETLRLSLRWLLLRSLRGGQDFARHKLAGRYGHLTVGGRTRFFLRALVQCSASIGLALMAWPLGRHRAAFWLLKASANAGKMSLFLGWHYREYDRPSP